MLVSNASLKVMLQRNDDGIKVNEMNATDPHTSTHDRDSLRRLTYKT